MSTGQENVYSTSEKHIPKKEKLNYLLGLGGQNIIYGLIGGAFFTYFLTDVARFPSEILIVLLILAKVWDGVNDPLIGSIVDKHTFKSGEKMRPLLKWMPIPIAVFTFLMFVAFPGDNLLWLRVSYFVIMYLCWDIVYTLQDVAIWSITAMSTPNPDERDNLVKWARTYGSVVFGIASMAIPMALEIFVKTTGLSWSVSIIIIVFILAFAGAGSSYKAYAIRERVPLAVKQESIKESFKLLKSNRILLLVSLSSILGAIGFGSSLVTYFFKYKITEEFINLPFIGALGMSTIFFTITSAPTFIAMLLVDKLKKICKDSFVLLLIAVQIICAVFRIIAYFIGFEGKMLWISMIVIAIGTLPTGVVSIAQTALFNDSIDLVEWKTGRRTEGMTFSMQTFFTKVSSGLNQGLAMLALSLMNYEAVDDSVPGAVLVGTQSQAFETWIWPLVILTPAIAAIAYVIPLLFIKYTKQQKQLVESDLEKRREGLPESGQSPYYREVLAPKFASVGATEADFENEN